MTAIEPSALLDAMPFARHCGVLMTLADTVGAACGFLNLPDGASTTTIESKSNFIRGVDKGAAIAMARPLHVGGRFIVIQTTITDSDERLVAQTTQTQAVLRS